MPPRMDICVGMCVGTCAGMRVEMRLGMRCAFAASCLKALAEAVISEYPARLYPRKHQTPSAMADMLGSESLLFVMRVLSAPPAVGPHPAAPC